MASGSCDKIIKIWNLEYGQIKELFGHSGFESIAFSPDGKTLASGSDDGKIKIWNLEIGVPIKELKGHSRNVNSVVFSPDGK